MPKLDRVDQKIFAINSGNEDKVKFGSLAEGTPQQAANLAEIQERATFELGWRNAVLGALSPTLNDRNSLDYLLSYQLAYIFQNGVPEWLGSSTYYTNSIIKATNGKLYISLQDDNTGNDPLVEKSSFWKPLYEDAIKKTAVFKNYSRKKRYETDVLPTGQNFFYAMSFANSGNTVIRAQGDSFHIEAGLGSIGGSVANANMTCCASSTQTDLTVAGRAYNSGEPLFFTNGSTYTNIIPVASVITAPANFNIQKIVYGFDGVNGRFVGVCSSTSRVLVINENTPTTGTFEVVQFNGSNVIWDSVVYDSVNGRYYISGHQSNNLVMSYSDDNGVTWNDLSGISGTAYRTSLFTSNGLVFVHAFDAFLVLTNTALEISDNGTTVTPIPNPNDLPCAAVSHVDLPDGKFLVCNPESEIGYITENFRSYEPLIFCGSEADASGTLGLNADKGPRTLSYLPLNGSIVGWNSNGTIMSLGDSSEIFN